MEQIKSYFKQVDARSAWVFGVSLFALVIFMYQAQPSFFWELFEERVDDPARLEWLAYTYFHIFVFVLFFVIPCLVVVFALKRPLFEFGLQVGDWRFGLKFLGLWVLIITPILYANSFMPAFQMEYPLVPLEGRGFGWFLLWGLIYLAYYVGWEFLFRGFMLFGLQPAIGAFYSICVQTIPSTIIHFGKPQAETVSAIFAGIVFGAVALRTRSILWPLLAHFYTGMANDIFCLINKGG